MDDENLALAAVARAVHSLSVPEKRLLRLALEGAPGRRITPSEYGARFGLSQGPAAADLRTAADGLFDATVKFPGSRPGSYEMRRLLTACDQKGPGSVRLSIASVVRELLVRIPEYLEE
ncbi:MULTISPECIES: hypothetical protein [unclassified Variovorax]|uniref:hypothetical protein n=1 Tax=unclassified Variovorax TaxID=663243 RepID=UPI0008390282|nr:MULTISPECIES: hypothetical protein [unclassified Variovorax]PNG49957.1 hypothetical protein CHC06_05538 [Variovorax sp. B2]PNG50829.1 hypothetical protein CHC07_05443 [Variovorax sp. B4]VTV18058.1 hypothetical protein WDL1P1_00882 [Variovorax sp. WDL1]